MSLTQKEIDELLEALGSSTLDIEDTQGDKELVLELPPEQCICEITLLMRSGCKCGGV